MGHVAAEIFRRSNERNRRIAKAREMDDELTDREGNSHG